ncbi:hypothetical protein AXF42_Ash010653 [Apostasia shenzhenica]|uniref:Uncharacterized protein n=1 Tax=Apostasia shenzhenica TaxID=1088818 RepID=A0A2I0A6N7_9ASPA|nr:hypothetical protein AXF42_Ash010653 [Apostasia shenzhenica]
MNHVGVQPHRLGRIEPAVACRHAEDLPDAVDLPEPDDQRITVFIPGHTPPHVTIVVGDERRRRGGVEVEEAVAEDDVGGGEVEAGARMVVRGFVDGVGEGREVGDGVGEMGYFAADDRGFWRSPPPAAVVEDVGLE